MGQLQTLLLFIAGFLVSRAIVKGRLPQKLVSIIMGSGHNSLSVSLLYLLTTAAAASIFIPNAIAMLAMLPLLDLLGRTFEEKGSRIPTMLTLSALYGSNIGGTGSIIGTPTNVLFIGFLAANSIPGVERITFLSWMLWGVPLVIIMVLLAWVVLCIGLGAWSKHAEKIHMPFAPDETEHLLQHKALNILLLYAGLAALLSYLPIAYPTIAIAVISLSVILTVFLIWYLFIHQFANGSTFVTFTDTYSDLPMEGLGWIVLATALGGVLYVVGIQDWLVTQIKDYIPHNITPFSLLLVTGLITIFATELLSNTAIQLAMSIVMLPIAQHAGVSPIQTLLVICLTCTCAFMTPTATPVNALAFGSARGVSVWHFMAVGAVMNVLSVLMIVVYVLHFVNY